MENSFSFLVISTLFAAVIGGVFGSFLNVVIWRLPNKMSLSKPGSHCPKCGHPIRFYDNLPVLGWLLLRGKCRDCHAPISVRYPLIEGIALLMTAGFFYAIAWAGWDGGKQSLLSWMDLSRWLTLWQTLSPTSGQVPTMAEAQRVILCQDEWNTLFPIACWRTTLWMAFSLIFLAMAMIEWDRKPIPLSLWAAAWVVTTLSLATLVGNDFVDGWGRPDAPQIGMAETQRLFLRETQGGPELSIAKTPELSIAKTLEFLVFSLGLLILAGGRFKSARLEPKTQKSSSTSSQQKPLLSFLRKNSTLDTQKPNEVCDPTDTSSQRNKNTWSTKNGDMAPPEKSKTPLQKVLDTPRENRGLLRKNEDTPRETGGPLRKNEDTPRENGDASRENEGDAKIFSFFLMAIFCWLFWGDWQNPVFGAPLTRALGQFLLHPVVLGGVMCLGGWGLCRRWLGGLALFAAMIVCWTVQIFS